MIGFGTNGTDGEGEGRGLVEDEPIVGCGMKGIEGEGGRGMDEEVGLVSCVAVDGIVADGAPRGLAAPLGVVE